MSGNTPPRISTPCQPYCRDRAPPPPNRRTRQPIVKPQNITVTRNERLRSGQYSEVSVIAIGMAPPRPRPVTKRQIVSDSTLVAHGRGDAGDAEANGREDQNGLAADPVGDRAEHEGARHQAGEPGDEQKRELRQALESHCARSAGAMKPMAAVSKPSAATTRKQSMRTMIWYRVKWARVDEFLDVDG